jgi:hypothetical protein
LFPNPRFLTVSTTLQAEALPKGTNSRPRRSVASAHDGGSSADFQSRRNRTVPPVNRYPIRTAIRTYPPLVTDLPSRPVPLSWRGFFLPRLADPSHSLSGCLHRRLSGAIRSDAQQDFCDGGKSGNLFGVAGMGKTVEELRLDAERLKRRIAEVEAFNAEAVTQRRGPEQQALQTAIDEALRQVFGKNSTRYQTYHSGTSLDNGPLSLMGPPSISTVRRYVTEGKARTLAMLRQAVKTIEEEIADFTAVPNAESKQMVDYDEVGRYAMAAICLHGHPLTGDIERHPSAKFCSECGASVITSCPDCSAPIRGHYLPPGVPEVGGEYLPPNFCFACGSQFPWTAEKLRAANDLADELEDVTPDERTKLKTAIEEVAGGGPRAEAGAARIKRMLGTATTTVGQALWRITVEIASDAAKKILLGG